MEIIIPSAALFALGLTSKKDKTGVKLNNNTTHFTFSLVTVIACIGAMLADHTLSQTLTPVISVVVGHYIGKNSGGV